MKTLYLIKHAKSDWTIPYEIDVERGLSEKGLKSIETMGYYLSLMEISPDIILSSCALRAQETTNLLAEKINFIGPKVYLKELYLDLPEMIQHIIMEQGSEVNRLFVVGHNPQLTTLANILCAEHIGRKIPSLGIVAISFDIDDWSELEKGQGRIDFFICSKKCYTPEIVIAKYM